MTYRSELNVDLGADASEHNPVGKTSESANDACVLFRIHLRNSPKSISVETSGILLIQSYDSSRRPSANMELKSSTVPDILSNDRAAPTASCARWMSSKPSRRTLEHNSNPKLLSHKGSIEGESSTGDQIDADRDQNLVFISMQLLRTPRLFRQVTK